MSRAARLALPLLRRLPPETAHRATLRALRVPLPGRGADPAQWGTGVTLPRSGLRLANPVGLAAGFDKDAAAFRPLARFGFGFIECGTVTPRPQSGNARPRLFRLAEDGAVINRMGFNNGGLEAFAQRLGGPKPPQCRIGANVGANKDSPDFAEDYAAGIQRLAPLCDYLTVNISSPNTPGLRGLQDKESLRRLLVRCEGALDAVGAAPPVFLKVAPDLDAEAVADICRVIGEDGAFLCGVIASNTTIARPETLRGRDRAQAGGLSGRPLLEPSTKVLALFARHLFGKADLIGAGGIASAQDALAKIEAGAHAVQLYSALAYRGPGLVAELNADLAALLDARGYASVAEAAGRGL